MKSFSYCAAILAALAILIPPVQAQDCDADCCTEASCSSCSNCNSCGGKACGGGNSCRGCNAWGHCGPCGSRYSATMFDHCCSAYCANVIWPRQFIPAARRGVCQTYAAMINNGWRRQNLLGDYHFEPRSNELTKAGELKVSWILTQAPMHRRNVYVQRAADEADTATRVASVQRYSGNLSPAVPDVMVNDTHIIARASTPTAKNRQT